MEFATLMPHLTAAGEELLRKIGLNNLLKDYSKYPESFKPVVPLLISSLVYHESFLRQHLYPNHPLFTQRLYTAKVTVEGFDGPGVTAAQLLLPHVVTGVNVCPEQRMVATGIPPHLLMLTEVEQVKFTPLRKQLPQHMMMLTKQPQCIGMFLSICLNVFKKGESKAAEHRGSNATPSSSGLPGHQVGVYLNYLIMYMLSSCFFSHPCCNHHCHSDLSDRAGHLINDLSKSIKDGLAALPGQVHFFNSMDTI
jgi:hypothetical protein